MYFNNNIFVQDIKFCHIPRTGGSSIQNYLGLQQCHRRASEINGNFKFSFVRNPWDRLLSLYFYKSNINDKTMKKRFKDFDDFACCINDIPMYSTTKGRVHGLCNVLSKNDLLGGYRLSSAYKPQTWWINSKLDFIGKYENYMEDIKSLCNIINVPFVPEHFPHISDTKLLHYTEYYSSKAKDAVYKRYKRDINKYNYEFESY